MSEPPDRIVEGIFAINKPSSISSAQVIRNLQDVLNPSTLFAPWLEREHAIRSQETYHERKRRKDKRVQVKIGHGGTLDPMATGVLIMGIGKGTRQLHNYLKCTKTYEATVLFGAATDTYDTLGNVMRIAAYDHITRPVVEKALEKFRGKIMQRPPIYSALRVDGKRLYEYAREGKKVPREIDPRPVEVKELEMVAWLERGTHKYTLPREEARPESRDIAEKVLHFGNATSSPPTNSATLSPDSHAASGRKRKRSLEDADGQTVAYEERFVVEEGAHPEIVMSGGLQGLDEEISSKSHVKSAKAVTNSDRGSPACAPANTGPPAAKLRMTVTSGFYVRSLAHDLGEAVSSLACMCALVRTRQGAFELGRNVLEYDDTRRGEKVWGPKVEALLTADESQQVLGSNSKKAEAQ